MFRFYNTTKMRGPAAGASAPPKRQSAQSRLSLFLLLFLLLPAWSFGQTIILDPLMGQDTAEYGAYGPIQTAKITTSNLSVYDFAGLPTNQLTIVSYGSVEVSKDGVSWSTGGGITLTISDNNVPVTDSVYYRLPNTLDAGSHSNGIGFEAASTSGGMIIPIIVYPIAAYVTPKPVSIYVVAAQGLTASKTYDGNDAIVPTSINGVANLGLNGVISGDDVFLSNPTGGNFVDPQASNTKAGTVYFNNGLAGLQAGNYVLTDNTFPLDAAFSSITKKNVAITATNQTKCYNIAFTGVADNTHFTDTGFVAGEGVATVDLSSVGSGSQAPAGNYPIVPSNAVALPGTDLSNYTITYVNGILKALPKLAVYINTVANQDVCAGNSISLNYTLEGPGLLSADLLISKVDGLITPVDTFHIDNKIAGSSQSVLIPDSLTPNHGGADVKYRLKWLNVTSDSIPCEGITNGQVDVTVHPAPDLAVSYTDSSVCSGSDWTLNLSNPNTLPGAVYKISANYGAATGNIPAAGVTNSFAVSSYTDNLVNNSGAPVVVTYTITTKSTTPGNCDGEYQIISVTVNPNPVLASVVADTVCEGAMTTITLSGLEPNTAYDVEGIISGNINNNGTAGTFSVPGLTGNFTADASGNFSFNYPTVYGDSVVTDYTAQVTKLTYSATGCSVDYSDSNKIGAGVVHPLPSDVFVLNGNSYNNGDSIAICEGSDATVAVTGDASNTYSLYRSDNTTLVVPAGNVGDSTYGFTAQLTDEGIYYLHLESAFGCATVDTFYLKVNPLPVFAVSENGNALSDGDTITYCEGSPMSLVLSGTAADSYTMTLNGTTNIGSGAIGSGINHDFTAALTDAGTYELTVATANGCAITQHFNLIVNPLPTDVFAINGTTVGTVNVESGDTAMACAGSPLTFTVTGNTADSFVLYRGATVVYSGHPGAPAYSFNAAASHSGTYYLYMMNSHGCTVADTFALIVNPLPQAAFVVNGFGVNNGDDLAYCEGSPMSLSLTGTASDAYVLLHGTDTVGVGHPNDPSYHFTAAVSDAGIYYLHLNNIHGCGTVDTYNVTIHPLPADVLEVNGSAVANGDTLTFCESSPVGLSLTGVSTDSFALYHGATLIGQGMVNSAPYNFNAAASDAGTYYMHLISAFGCETVDTIEMVVNPLPTATLTFNTDTLANGASVIACVASPVTLELTGNTSDAYTLLHGADTVGVGHPNDPAFTFDAAMADAGTYYLHLVNQYGCGVVDTFNLDVDARPGFALSIDGFPAVANDSATALDYCINDSITIGVNIDTAYTFNVIVDGAVSAPIPGINSTDVLSMSSFTAGIHSFGIIVTNQNGCDSTMTVYFNVHPLPVYTTMSVTPVTCNGGNTGAFTFQVDNSGVEAEDYTLTIIDIDNGNDTVYTAQAASVAAGGNFMGTQQNLYASNYKVVVSNAFGCGTVDTVVITEPAALALNMTHIDVSCGAVVPDGKLKVKPEGGVTNGGNYSITLNGPGANNAQYTAPGGTYYSINQLSGGIYTVTLTDANGCSLTQTDTIMQPSANIVTTVNGPDTVNMNASASVILSATGAALPVTYTYTVNGGAPQTVTSSASSADVSLTVATGSLGTVLYTVTSVTDAHGNACNTVLGSHSVEVVNVSVVDLRPVIDLTSNSLTTQYNTTDGSIALLNVGNSATSGPITILVSKPSSSIALNFSGATGWTVSQIGNFYQLVSNTVISGNNGFTIIPFTVTLVNSGQYGAYLINASVINGSGGDNNAANNSIKTAVNVSQ